MSKISILYSKIYEYYYATNFFFSPSCCCNTNGGKCCRRVDISFSALVDVLGCYCLALPAAKAPATPRHRPIRLMFRYFLGSPGRFRFN